MTELDTELGPIAVDVINEFGKAVNYEFSGEPEYDPETATAVADPLDPLLDIKAIVEDVKGKTTVGGMIEMADKKITVAASLFPRKPTPLDTFTVDAEKFTVMKDGVKTTYSGELACIYEIKGQR